LYAKIRLSSHNLAIESKRFTGIRQQPFSYLGGEGAGIFGKTYCNALADRKKIRFCIVAEKKIMLSQG
jgi:hypothetical protein